MRQTSPVQLGEQHGTSVSFAVGSKHGPRSLKWNVTVRGEDVYINADGMASSWHVSLHESGENHVRHDFEGRPLYLRADESRLPPGAYRVGLFVVIPDTCLRPIADPDRQPEPTKWFVRPSY